MNIHVDDLIFRLNPYGGIARLWRELAPQMAKALPEHTFDPHQPCDLFISTYYAPAPQGVPSLVLCYDFIAERYPAIGKDNADAIAKRKAIENASAVVAISEWVAQDVEKFCGRGAAVAYPGVSSCFQRALPDDVDAFQRKYGIDRPYVLMVGKRGLYKNGRALYQAWQASGYANGHALLFVGGEQIAADEQAFTSHLNGNAYFVDRLTDQELAAAYSGATCLAYLSFYEGFGLPVPEAMMCGCPVVCANTGALPEALGDSGFYCDVTRPLSVAAAMNATLDPSTRFHKVYAGMKRARTFTWQRMAEQMAAVIRQIA